MLATESEDRHTPVVGFRLKRRSVMQDFWYGDKLDLIKWGVLLRLAERFDAGRILQIAFNPRTMEFGRLVIDGEKHDIPPEVIAHFRNLRTIGSISSKIKVTVFEPLFQEKHRALHLEPCSLSCRPFGKSAASSSLIRARASNPRNKSQH